MKGLCVLLATIAVAIGLIWGLVSILLLFFALVHGLPNQLELNKLIYLTCLALSVCFLVVLDRMVDALREIAGAMARANLHSLRLHEEERKKNES